MSFYQQLQQLPSKHSTNDSLQLAQKSVDKNQTYSFDSLPSSIFQPKTEKPFVKLHQQLNENLSKLNNLRKQSDQENQELTQLRQFLIRLNTAIHDNTQTVKEMRNDKSIRNDSLLNMYQHHNKLLNEQISYFQTLPNFEESNKSIARLNQKVVALQKEVQEEKLRMPVSENSEVHFDEKEKLKLKIQYLKQQYEELDEFIHKEIEFEKEEDLATIQELTKTISSLSGEVDKVKESLNKSKASHLSAEYSVINERIKNAKYKITKFNNEIISLRTENEKIQATFDIELENIKRLERERDALKKLEVLKSSS